MKLTKKLTGMEKGIIAVVAIWLVLMIGGIALLVSNDVFQGTEQTGGEQ